MIKISITDVQINVTKSEQLTSGMVGKQIEFTFSNDWDNLEKIVCFSAGKVKKDRLIGDSGIITIPAEILENASVELNVGVKGLLADGTIKIPTLYTSLGLIATGATPCDDYEDDPDISIIEQLIQEVRSVDVHSPVIRDGYWYTYNETTHEYENTGIEARGPQGDDYELTETDKQDIADIVLGEIDAREVTY